MMFEKGKRERRTSEEDRVFNRMLLWLAGAVVVELLFLLLQQAYVVMRWGGMVSKALLTFFEIFSIAGAVIAVGCAVWGVLSARNGKRILLPVVIGAVSAGLWVVSLLCRLFFDDGVRLLMMLPAAAAVLILIFFLYQRPFFYNAIFTGGGLLAIWLQGRYYLGHPTLVTICFVAGFVALAAVAALALQLRKTDGRLGALRVLPAGSSYMMTWLTCAVTAAAMAAALAVGASLCHYLLYVLVGWLFAQAVFFTVKMM